MATITGCHLVGSVPLPDTEEVFKQCTKGMPGRLKRIPDGETGNRHYFTYFQAFIFQAVPQMMPKFTDNAEMVHREFSEQEVDDGVEQLKKAGLETGYDTAALESYATFKKSKDEGTMPQDIKFQVCLPTPANVIGPFVERAFQAEVYPIYEEALYRAMRNIQDKIPHEHLAIQIDLAVDTAFWEGVYLKPWFDQANKKEFILDYITRMLGQIDQDVDVGFHNCYGDMEHKHWWEPTSLSAVVERGIGIFDRSPHKIAWFHCPVPVSAMDKLDTFLAPLKDLAPKLKEHGTELYLGVVQYNDSEGTKKRIEAASKVVDEFGVATECGWGRTPPEQIENIMQISTEVAEPVR